MLVVMVSQNTLQIIQFGNSLKSCHLPNCRRKIFGKNWEWISDEFMQIFVSQQSKKCHRDGWFGILDASLEALIDIEPKWMPKTADYILWVSIQIYYWTRLNVDKKVRIWTELGWSLGLWLGTGIGLWLGTGDPKSLKVREIFDKVWLGTGDPKKFKIW